MLSNKFLTSLMGHLTKIIDNKIFEKVLSDDGLGLSLLCKDLVPATRFFSKFLSDGGSGISLRYQRLLSFIFHSPFLYLMVMNLKGFKLYFSL